MFVIRWTISWEKSQRNLPVIKLINVNISETTEPVSRNVQIDQAGGQSGGLQMFQLKQTLCHLCKKQPTT